MPGTVCPPAVSPLSPYCPQPIPTAGCCRRDPEHPKPDPSLSRAHPSDTMWGLKPLCAAECQALSSPGCAGTLARLLPFREKHTQGQDAHRGVGAPPLPGLNQEPSWPVPSLLVNQPQEQHVCQPAESSGTPLLPPSPQQPWERHFLTDSNVTASCCQHSKGKKRTQGAQHCQPVHRAHG